MRGWPWLVLVAVACGGKAKDTDPADSGTAGTAPLEELCVAEPIPDYDVSALPCGKTKNEWRSTWRNLLRAASPCRVDDDCRVQDGHCEQNLDSCPDIAVNRCLSADVVQEFLQVAIRCDHDTRSGCSDCPTSNRAICVDGSCELDL